MTTMTDRKYNQIKAAVIFWRQVVEHSSTHPCNHPAVAAMFENHAPLTLAELDDLIDKTPGAGPWETIKAAARRHNILPRMLMAEVRSLGIKPADPDYPFYETDQLQVAVQAVLDSRRKLRR